MSILLLLAGVGSMGICLTLLLKLIFVNRSGPSVVNSLRDYTQSATGEGDSASEQRLATIATGVGNRLKGRFKQQEEEVLHMRLLSAGLYNWSVSRYLGYRAIATAILPAGILMVSVAVNLNSMISILGLAVAGFAGWKLPGFYIDHRIDNRNRAIDYELPQLTDLLVVSVEAGVGLVASLKLASETIHGPLQNELSLLLQEQQMGLATDESLRNFSKRCPTPSVRAFTRALIQAEQLGVSIGKIMRDLADETRKRRRARAEEQAAKSSVKMLFPLVLLIFPAMMIVLLGPALLQMTRLF